MVFIEAVSVILILSGVKSEEIDKKTVCYDDYRDMNNASIDVWKNCQNKLCIEKCCGKDEILDLKGRCINASKIKDYSQDNFTQIPLYSWDGSKKESKKNLSDFHFVQNRRMTNNICTYPVEENYVILEDGSMKEEIPNDLIRWSPVKPLNFCIDYQYVSTKNDTKLKLQFVVKYPIEYNEETVNYHSIGMLISCFFLMLVLVVYYLLPQLRNMEGLILMAYVWSLFITYLSRAILYLTDQYSNQCKIISPLMYFVTISTFCWLSIMSFDLWWTLRGHRLRLEIQRWDNWVKFLWYSLYAYGIPLLMTAGATILDNVDLTNWPSIITPGFDTCLYKYETVLIYTHIPIAILTGFNIIMFIMTAYNIWKIKRGVTESEDSRRSNKDKYRFVIYLRLAIMMGVGWILEVIPVEEPVLEYLFDTYNLFTGVAIFFLFVFKKRILLMLCKRFGIQNEFVQKLQASQSGTTRTTRLSSIFKSSKSHAREDKA